MPTARQLIQTLAGGGLDPSLRRIYPADTLPHQRARFHSLLEAFQAAWPEGGEVDLYSAPGRTELGGNHTDHNAGRVLAGAVTLDTVAVAARAPEVRVRSEGYPDVDIDAADRRRRAGEEHTPASVVRGVLARLGELGKAVGGFHAVVSSDVPEGSGLSSSAAFEMLVVCILNHLYCAGRLDPVVAAQVGQYAENEYFGKPSGLMDQTTSAVGGVVTIDFRDPGSPVVRGIRPPKLGHALVVVNTGGSHAGLTSEYAAIRDEMESVARELGVGSLGHVDREPAADRIAAIREKTGDRALLRALHFWGEQRRVPHMATALERGEIPRYLELVNESGRSSWTLNQNCYAPAFPRTQPIPLALALSEKVLGGRGAARVHGGGFAGTIQAYIPPDLLGGYRDTMRAVFGAHACVELQLRDRGACRVLEP